MQVAIRTIGNSRGIVLPKPVLAQIGLVEADVVDMSVEDGAIVLRPAPAPVRQGWEAAAKGIAAKGDDQLVLGDFGNEDDAEWTW
ncbi:MAG: AbrB/MazE/SpoVT family DNA-binding domain-containing protein [Pseudoxanthomonas sp.]